MNTQSSQAYAPLRLLTERLTTGVSKTLRAASVLPRLWRANKARRREVLAFDAITDLNEHTLRDIGASDRMIAHAAGRSDADHRLRISVQQWALLWVVALIATAAFDAAGEPADSRQVSKASSEANVVGVFTGEYLNGAPIYRFPPVNVVVSRKVERAKLEREEQSTRAQQARARAAARPPA